MSNARPRRRLPIRSAIAAWRCEALEGRRLLAAIASDQTVTGSIGALGETDDYTINAIAGESIVVVAADTGATVFNPRVSIIAPGGTVLDTEVGATGLLAFSNNLAASGTYTVRVIDDANNATGSYALTAMTSTATPAANDGDGGTIASGQRKLGTVSLGDLDVYQFTASAGDSVALALAETTANATFTPEMVLYKPNGAQLDFNLAASGSNMFEGALATAGTYTLLVYNNNLNDTAGASAYAVSLAKLPGTVNADATDTDGGAISSGQRRLGSISAGDLDVYTFTAGIGESVELALGDTGPTAFVPQMVVYSPTGTQLNYNFGQAGSLLFFTNLAASGTYYVVVNDQSGAQTGSYALSLAKLPGAQAANESTDPTTNVLSDGQRVRGYTDVGDIDVYTFTANVNQSVTLDVGDLDGTAYVPEIVLYGPTGNQIDYNFSTSGTLLTVNNLTVGGTYYVAVFDNSGTNTGDYALSFAKSATTLTTDPLDPDGGAITNGERRVGTISVGDNDVFTFTANIGQSATLTLGDLDATGFVPQMDVYTPSGTLLDFNFGSNGSRLEFDNLAVGGTYTVIVHDNGGDVPGRYALALAKLTTTVTADATDSDGGTLASGGTHIGSLPMGDSDVYTFTATSGVATTLRVQDLLGDAFVPRITLYGPTGNYIDATTNGSLAALTFTPGTTGTYSAVIADSSGAATGSYSVALNGVAPTVDNVSPVVTSGIFNWTKAPHEVRIGFSESVLGTIDFDDLAVQNDTTGETIDSGLMSAVYDANSYEGVFTFPSLTNGLLPDGNYTATFAAGKATDAAGNPSTAYSFKFFVLTGDLNRDRKVDFSDLLILAKSYNKAGRTPAEGNIDYDANGAVGFSDLLLLAKNYNRTLPAQAAFAAVQTPVRKRPALIDGIE